MKKRVLYIDDNPHNRQYVSRIVAAEGYEMLEACDGESGWHIVHQEVPDMIFMDLLMPGIDGFELMRQIKARPELSHIPIVTLTAYGNSDTERLAKAAGSDGFLHKPTNTLQLRTILRQFLGINTARRELDAPPESTPTL